MPVCWGCSGGGKEGKGGKFCWDWNPLELFWYAVDAEGVYDCVGVTAELYGEPAVPYDERFEVDVRSSGRWKLLLPTCGELWIELRPPL